jgi:hypothetical protein
MKVIRYKLTNGDEAEVEYDENAPCKICGEPVTDASMGGPDICPWCDCGTRRDGLKWSFTEYMGYMHKLKESKIDKFAKGLYKPFFKVKLIKKGGEQENEVKTERL